MLHLQDISFSTHATHCTATVHHFSETGIFPRCCLNKTQQILWEGSTFSSLFQVFQKPSQTSTKPGLLHIAAVRDCYNSKNHTGSFRLISTGLESSCICSLCSIVQVRFGLLARSPLFPFRKYVVGGLEWRGQESISSPDNQRQCGKNPVWQTLLCTFSYQISALKY